MSLPNPQEMSDAQSLNIFAQAVSQAKVKLVNSPDIESAEHKELEAYYEENLTKLKIIVERL